MEKAAEITLSYLCENAVLVEWPETICPQQHQQIMCFQQQLQTNLTGLLIDSVASYTSLILYYHFEKIKLTKYISLVLLLYFQCLLSDRK